MSWKINTSNANKLDEFRRYLGEVESIRLDLQEPNADDLTVIRYKASQFENVLVDDTSLFIEGESVGVNIRWLLDKLPDFIGKRATFVCLLGIRRGNKVEIYEGKTEGTIVPACGDSFGFNNHFLPIGSSKTLGEVIPNEINPRFIAVTNLLNGKPKYIEPLLSNWGGSFQ